MRLVICLDRQFPFGDAAANLAVHLATAAREEGWEPFVIGRNRKGSDPKGVRESIPYQNLLSARTRVGRAFAYFGTGLRVGRILKGLKLQPGDRVLIYSSNLFYIRPVLFTANRTGARVIFEVVEWHQPWQFKRGRMEPFYLNFDYCFRVLYPSTGYVIAISRRLQAHFEARGCRVLLMPPLAGRVTVKRVQLPEQRPVRFIYSGNPWGKDNFGAVLAALCLLSESERNRLEFHITGQTCDDIVRELPFAAKHLKDLDRSVVFHDWLEYSELEKLYDECSFLLLVRDSNIVTESNFPSKIPEALGRGVVPVVSPVGDIRQYLQDGHDAIFVGSSDAKVVAGVLRRILSYDSGRILHMRANAYQTASVVFGTSAWAPALGQFLSGTSRHA